MLARLVALFPSFTLILLVSCASPATQPVPPRSPHSPDLVSQGTRQFALIAPDQWIRSKPGDEQELEIRSRDGSSLLRVFRYDRPADDLSTVVRRRRDAIASDFDRGSVDEVRRFFDAEALTTASELEYRAVSTLILSLVVEATDHIFEVIGLTESSTGEAHLKRALESFELLDSAAEAR